MEAQTAELTVGGVVGTGYHIFTFDAPAASYVQLNMAHSFGGSVTVTGLNFRYVEYTATGQLVSGVCSTTSWSSSTSVACLASALWDAEGSVYDVMRAVQVTVGGVRGDIDGGVQLRCACCIVCETEHGSQLRGVCDSDGAAVRAE